MKKYIFYLLDIALLLAGLASLASSYVLWFLIPRGVGLHGSGSTYCGGGGIGIAGNYQPFLGMFRYTWIDIHNWTSVVLALVILIHLVLHWSWIIEMTIRFDSYLQRRTNKVLELYGSFLILVLLFVFDCLSGLVLWLVLPRGARDFNLMIGGAGRTFLGLQRNVWLDLHAWVAVTIVALIVIHLILNWNWVAGVSKKIFWENSAWKKAARLAEQVNSPEP